MSKIKIVVLTNGGNGNENVTYSRDRVNIFG